MKTRRSTAASGGSSGASGGAAAALLDLPPDLLRKLVGHLTAEDVARASSSCRAWAKALRAGACCCDKEGVWRVLTHAAPPS